MPEVDINPALPITITATIDTPLLINAEFLYRLPNETKWKSFFKAGVGHEVPSQVFESVLEAVPEGTLLLLTFVFSGAKNTAYRASIVLTQGGAEVGDKRINGSTKTKYSSYKEVEISLT